MGLDGSRTWQAFAKWDSPVKLSAELFTSTERDFDTTIKFNASI